MILYRCLDNLDNTRIKHQGNNTFSYDPLFNYKHFFVFSEHAEFYKNKYMDDNATIGQFIVPKNIIIDNGFGFYNDVKTRLNHYLAQRYIPLPEVILKSDDYKGLILYKEEKTANRNFLTNTLDDDDNIKYNEEKEEYFNIGPEYMGYMGYSYADIYYEIVYDLLKKYNNDMVRVVEGLKKMRLPDDIKNYYEDNKNEFRRKMVRYSRNLRR